MSKTSQHPVPIPAAAERHSEPASSVDLSEEVLITLRKAIVSGALAAGDRLPEAATAAQLGVSRVPVREAMLQMEREGLLRFDSRGSASVRELTKEDFEEIYSLRLHLEPLAAKLACRHLNEYEMELLEANIARTRKASRLLEVTLLDVEFHDLIMRASRHSRLLQCWQGLKPQLEIWLHRMHRHFEAATRRTRETTVREHCRLLDAFRSCNPEDVAARMKKHTAGWRDQLDQLLSGETR